MGMPCPDSQQRCGRLVARHRSAGRIPRPCTAFHRVRQHYRFMLREHRAAQYRPRHRTPLLRPVSAADHPRHGPRTRPAGRCHRHKAYRHPRRQFRRRLPGPGMGGRATRTLRATRAHSHVAQSLALDNRYRRNPAYGHSGRLHLRRTALRRRQSRTGGGTRHRTTHLPRPARLQRNPAEPPCTRRRQRSGAPAPISATREKNSARDSTPIPTKPSSTPSTPTT